MKERIIRLLRQLNAWTILVNSWAQECLCYERLKKYYILALIIVAAQYCHAIFPFVATDIPIINEYWDLPESTYIVNANGAGEYVDNTGFINTHQLFGLQRKYDPRTDEGKNVVSAKLALKLPLTDELEKFISSSNHRYFYDDESKSLVVNGTLSKDDCSALLKSFPSEQAKINRFSSNVKHDYDEMAARKMSDAALQFLAANYQEWGWQIRGQGILHHHSFIYEPMRDLYYGKPAAQCSFQYGYGMALLLMGICLIFGGLKYAIFIKVIYSFYLLGFALFVFVAYKLTRRWDAVLLVMISYSMCVLKLDFMMLCAYDGANPVRYIFVMPAMYCFYRYCKSQARYDYWLTIVCNMLMLLLNAPNGLFLCTALLVALAYRIMFERGNVKKNLFDFLVLVVTSLIAWKLATPAPDIMGKYFLAGFLSTGATAGVEWLLVAYVASYAVLLCCQLSVLKKSYMLFLLLLVQQSALFYVVEGVIATSIPFIVLVGMFFTIKLKCFAKGITAIGLLACLWGVICLWYPAVLLHYETRGAYFTSVSSHAFNKLLFDKFDIYTDIQPQLLVDAVVLIDKYSREREIALLSRYDTLLLPAADKINYLPYSDVRAMLFAQSEIDSLDSWLQNPPKEYLFVDSDIAVNHAVDMVLNPRVTSLLAQTTAVSIGEATWRVSGIDEFAMRWSKIKDRYAMVERGALISVYRRVR